MHENSDDKNIKTNRLTQTIFKPAAESASESESLSEILLLQYFDGVSIPDTFTSNDGAVAQ